MKKVGILTYHSSDNYGSVLQAYALRKFLSEFCDAEIIDYRKPEVKKLYKIFKPISSKFNIITNIYNALYYLKLKNRKISYEDFRTKYLNLSEYEINEKDKLEKFVNRYDTLICGSDQVWNFDICDFDTSFLLDFPEFEGNKVAYAASMGPKKKSSEQVAKYKELFNSFNEISVRESSAASVLEDVLKKPVNTLIDPVFLLSKQEWEQSIKQANIKQKKQDYVFCYFPGGVSKNLENFSVELAKKLNCKRILTVPEWRNIFRSGKKMYNCAPFEFVDMIKNAKAVCTDSFHGTALSIIMDTPFYVEIGNGATDSRINTLISLSGMYDSVINNNFSSTKKTETDIEDFIDFSKNTLKDAII